MLILDYYYIDKTGLIVNLLSTSAAKVTLITRPRRFGKTLGMSMLSEFFDIRKNNIDMFTGLEISDYPDLCAKWMNQYILFCTTGQNFCIIKTSKYMNGGH